MLTPILITYIILAVAVVVFLSDRLRPDLIALLVAISLGITGVLTPQEAFSGFSRSAVITILAIFVLAEGLQRTGVTEQVGKLLLRIAGPRESWLAITVMLTGALLSLFMNNIAAASVLLPAVSGAAQKARANPSKLFMPLAFGTILGGMATLLTTTNIVVSSLLRDQGLQGFGLLDFAPLGFPIILVGVLYMALIGRRLLPSQSSIQRLLQTPHGESDLAGIYRLGERLIRARITHESPLIGKALSQSNLRQEYNLNLVGIERNARRVLSPSPEFVFSDGDILLMEGRPEDLSAKDYHAHFDLLLDSGVHDREFESQKIVIVEAVLTPRSELIGKTLRNVHFREKYNMSVLGIWRAGRPIRTRLSDLSLQFGDALLLQGSRRQLPILRTDTELIVLNGAPSTVIPNPAKAWLALAIMLATLVVAASSLPIGEVMLGGALAMVLLNVLTMDQAYQAIDWKTVFLVAGMLPLGVAMTKTGAAANLAEDIIRLLGSAGPLALLAGLFILATLLTQVMNGAAVAAVVAPIAINIALRVGIEPRSLAMGIALATSMAFITPLGHPVNILVMGTGGYHFRDYLKVGLPMALLLLVVILLLLPVIWPLT